MMHYIQRFLTHGKNQYSDILYDLAAEIGLSHYKAQQEYARIGSRITSFLGNLEDGKNVGLAFTLWIAVELALSFYFQIVKISLTWFMIWRKN